MSSRIVLPQPRHIEGLVRLSTAFADEFERASAIPIGQINSPEVASARLFGSDAIAVVVAETEAGEMTGYAGVYTHPESVYLSILVGAPYRRAGLGKRLVEEVFGRLPGGLIVEAWVGEFNKDSLAAMPRLGFRLDRTLEDDGHSVRVFVRRT